jgi:hypothetical protein
MSDRSTITAYEHCSASVLCLGSTGEALSSGYAFRVLGCNVLMQGGGTAKISTYRSLRAQDVAAASWGAYQLDIGGMSVLWAHRKLRDGGNDVNDPIRTCVFANCCCANDHKLIEIRATSAAAGAGRPLPHRSHLCCSTANREARLPFLITLALAVSNDTTPTRGTSDQ